MEYYSSVFFLFKNKNQLRSTVQFSPLNTSTPPEYHQRLRVATKIQQLSLLGFKLANICDSAFRLKVEILGSKHPVLSLKTFKSENFRSSENKPAQACPKSMDNSSEHKTARDAMFNLRSCSR
jgi:hypothetical protein